MNDSAGEESDHWPVAGLFSRRVAMRWDSGLQAGGAKDPGELRPVDHPGALHERLMIAWFVARDLAVSVPVHIKCSEHEAGAYRR